MLHESIVKLLNEQINKEFYSAYLYLDLADYYANEGLEGFENWFVIQAKEEQDHAMLFRQYLLNNGHSVNLEAIANPSAKYSNHKEPLVASLEHERYITSSINDIYTEALSKKDYRTVQFLEWFVKEQGEEEKNSEDNIRKYELFGDGKGLYMLDQSLQARLYSPPSLVLE